MKRLIAIPVLLVLVTVYWTVARADNHETNDIEAIEAATEDGIAAWNAGDAKAIARHRHSSGGSTFYPGGDLLSVWGGPTDNIAEFQAWFDSGGKVNMQSIDHLDIKVYGNTAIVTGYITATTTSPSGKSWSGTWRSSTTRIKEDGMWKTIHAHTSPLIVEPYREIEPLDDDDDHDD